VAAGVAGLTILGAPNAFALRSPVGPIDATTGFPSYVTDDAGTSLDLCLDSPFCLGTRAELTAPEGEAFWWNSEATMPTSGGSALMVLAVEAAYGGATAGTESAFSRVRFRIDVAKPGHYTVRYPYGSQEYDVTTTGRRAINDTADIGCVSAGTFDPCTPARFAFVAQGPITNYLKWDPDALPATPAGFIGDANTPHRVVGGASSVFRVEGPDVGGPGVHFVETNLMTVQGRLASTPDAPPPTDQTPAAAPATVTATAVSSTQINVSWSAVTGAAGYRVYRDDAPVPVGPQQAGTTYSDTGLPPSSAHRYRVTSVDAAGNESALSTAVGQATTAAAAGVPAAVVSPTSLRFGNVRVGTSRTLTTTVRNAGTAPLNVTGMTMSGAGAARYARSGGTCSTATPVAQGASCTVTVRYSPTTRNARSLATLTISSNAGADAIALSGRAN